MRLLRRGSDSRSRSVRRVEPEARACSRTSSGRATAWSVAPQDAADAEGGHQLVEAVVPSAPGEGQKSVMQAESLGRVAAWGQAVVHQQLRAKPALRGIMLAPPASPPVPRTRKQ